MKGKVGGDKQTPGIYHVRIETADAYESKKGNKMLKVKYRILDGDDTGSSFTEFLNFVSAKFLDAIGQPSGIGVEWDTEKWQNQELWVTVKYSEDEKQYPRFSHNATAPLDWKEGTKGTVTATDQIPPIEEDGEIPF